MYRILSISVLGSLEILSAQNPIIRVPGTPYSDKNQSNSPYGQKITNIKEMWCQISDIWNHDTRVITCTTAGDDNNYNGTVSVIFDDNSVYSEFVNIEQSTINRNGAEQLEYWGVFAITIVNDPLGSNGKPINRVVLKLAQPDVEWKNPYAPAPPSGGTHKECSKFLFWKHCKTVNNKK